LWPIEKKRKKRKIEKTPGPFRLQRSNGFQQSLMYNTFSVP
jgi:hypothetical protein